MFEKILIVEDDADMRLAIVDKLLELHYEVIQAEDGEQAVAEFTHQKPSLIILDLMLPKLGGFGVLEALKQQLDIVKTPVVIYSNMDKPESIQKAKDFKIDDYMLKAQSQIDEVCKRVQDILQKQ
jgi:DNA-binding response OmpR family regulator